MKNLANFKTAVRSREYLIQAIFQMLFDNQVASKIIVQFKDCLLYTSPSPRDHQPSRMPSSA